jgi:importin subunit alpha-2
MNATKESIRKEACWTVSNVTAGNRQQIQLVLDANIVPTLISLMKGSSEFKTRKEAAWAIVNATSGGSPDQIRHLVAEGCIPALCEFLTVQDSKMIQVALNGLDNVLRVGAADARASGGVNRFAVNVEECYGLDKIEFLQSHENMDIYQKAFTIIEQYFGAEDEDEDDKLRPAEEGQQFRFQPGDGSAAAPGAPGGGFKF